MLESFLALPFPDNVILLLLILSFNLVMFYCALSFMRSPALWWDWGIPAAPILQFLMWLGAFPFILPLVVLFMRRRRALHTAPLVGHVRSRKFHQRRCEYTLKESSALARYPLSSADEALRNGFVPCIRCKGRDE